MTRLLVILILLFGCDPRSQRKHSNDECSNVIKFKKVIEAVIKMPELQKYLNAEVIDKNKNLIILKNDAINGEFDLGKFDPPIDLLSKDQIVKADIKAFIEFEKISLKGDTADVYFKYDIEGVGCEAKYFLVNCNWRLSSKRLWEN